MTHTTTPLPPASGLPPAGWAQLILTEARMTTRDTSGLILPIGMPLLIMVMNGLGDSAQQVLPSGSTVMNQILMPLTVTMVVALVGVVNMPSFVASYRKYGVLKQLAVTPARPMAILLAQVAVSLAQILVGVVLMLAVGMTSFGVALPRSVGWALVAGVLLVAAMYAVGLLIAATAPTVNAGLALGLGAFFVMLALGGGFGPTENLPDVLEQAGALLPYGAGNHALSAAWTGEAPRLQDVGVLGAWTLVAGGLAGRFFRWT